MWTCRVVQPLKVIIHVMKSTVMNDFYDLGSAKGYSGRQCYTGNHNGGWHTLQYLQYKEYPIIIDKVLMITSNIYSFSLFLRHRGGSAIAETKYRVPFQCHLDYFTSRSVLLFSCSLVGARTGLLYLATRITGASIDAPSSASPAYVTEDAAHGQRSMSLLTRRSGYYTALFLVWFGIWS